MQPYTPHGDSNMCRLPESPAACPMQPYTPHGDSNGRAAIVAVDVGGQMQPYTPHGDSNTHVYCSRCSAERCNLIPLTGTVTKLRLFGP